MWLLQLLLLLLAACLLMRNLTRSCQLVLPIAIWKACEA
jgi:hypothetical protein